jgi:hypothetical protein
MTEIMPDNWAKLDGNQLFNFYEARKLTREQIKELYEREMTKYKGLSQSHIDEFLQSGVISQTLPPQSIFEAAMDALYPDTSFPMDDILKSINEHYNRWFIRIFRKKKKVSFKGFYILVDGISTQIMITEVSKVWGPLLKFNSKKKSLKIIGKMVAKKLP